MVAFSPIFLESLHFLVSADFMLCDPEIVMFEFGRHRLAKLDFGLFFQRYTPEKWPAGAALRKQMGTLLVIFHGFDDDARELHCIPEVRRFVQEFRRIWPYWLFFMCPMNEVSTLPLFTACCLEKLNVIQVRGSAVCGIDCDPDDIRRFLAGLLPGFKLVADRAGLFPKFRREHLIEAYAAFGLVPDEIAMAAAGAVENQPR